MEVVLVYPNQLFSNHPALSRKIKILLIEDPLFFKDTQYPILFHKKKILLHYLSIKYYREYLNNKGYDTSIISFKELNGKSYTNMIFKKFRISTAHIVHVVDFTLKERILNASKIYRSNIVWYDSPGFLLNQTEVNQEFSNKKKHLMANFYKKQRRKYNLLLDSNGEPLGGKWSFDTENRKKLPKDIIIPNALELDYKKETLLEGKLFVEKEFKNNPGNLENFNYPINHHQAVLSFDNFLEKRFSLFGPYEDAISDQNHILFHSVLTPYLNLGLITPSDVITKIIDYSKYHKIPINSVEGLIRQIIGWREFIRGIYELDGVKQRTTNYWGFSLNIPEKFYSGKTGILPLDKAISRCENYGYTHHIERLMVIGNIMALCGFDPNSVYKWFMEFFVDAYDWVMVPNVYGMSQFADGGLMSTKPYISGSNYIIKMSNYKKNDWCNIWDSLYWEFINKHRNFFLKNPRMAMMVSLYEKKPKEMKMKYIDIKNNFIEQN